MHTLIGVFLLCCLFDFAPAGVLFVLYRKLRARRLNKRMEMM